MELLPVPLVLAVGAGVFTWLIDTRQREGKERRARAEQELSVYTGGAAYGTERRVLG
jgi:hypothetical protein